MDKKQALHAFRLPQRPGPGKLSHPLTRLPGTAWDPTTVIDWNQIDTVLLDMDGTLLDLQYDNYFWLRHMPRRYAEIHSRDETETRKVAARFEKQRGTLNWYCLDHWSRELNLDIPALKLEIQHMIRMRPHVENFLGKAAQQRHEGLAGHQRPPQGA